MKNVGTKCNICGLVVTITTCEKHPEWKQETCMCCHPGDLMCPKCYPGNIF